jgi:hypothetical protein
MIIGITGLIGSGKDTVASCFVNRGCLQDSFAAPLKDVCASIFGWKRSDLEGDTTDSRDFRETADMFWTRKLGIDNFTPRLALQLMGTEVLRTHFHKDIWIDSLEYRMRRAEIDHPCVVISDTRFTNELDLIKRLGGVVINVERGDKPEWYETATKANNGHVPSQHTMNTKFKQVHLSEWNWIGYDFDHVLTNNDTLDALQTGVDSLHELITENDLKK